MNAQELFQVDFRELTAGELTRSWHLDDSFFSALDEQEIEHGELTATLRVKKKAAGYLLNIHATGTVEIPCDRCLAPMTQPIDAEDEIDVRFGETLEDDGDRITLPEDRPVLNVAWNLYDRPRTPRRGMRRRCQPVSCRGRRTRPRQQRRRSSTAAHRFQMGCTEGADIRRIKQI